MKYFALLLLSGFLYTGCTECTSPTTTTPNTTLKKQVLHGIAYNVIFASYSELLTCAGELQAAVTHLADVRTPEALDSARTSWRRCHSKWMLTQAYLFGPVKYEQIDTKIDTWPISITDLGGINISPDELHFRNGSVKGFHTIEFLLFGDSVNKQVTQITQREHDYLSSLTYTLVRDIELLVSLWDEGSGNFVGNFANAGDEGSDYDSIEGGFDELMGNIGFITDVIGNRKIFDARYGTPPNPIVLESRYSRNTNYDYADVIRSIKNIYLGGYNVEGKGLSTLVLEVDKDLDAQTRQHIEDAISAIDNMKPWIGEAMFNDKAKLEIAIQAVTTLQGDMDIVTEIVTSP